MKAGKSATLQAGGRSMFVQCFTRLCCNTKLHFPLHCLHCESLLRDILRLAKKRGLSDNWFASQPIRSCHSNTNVNTSISVEACCQAFFLATSYMFHIMPIGFESHLPCHFSQPPNCDPASGSTACSFRCSSAALSVWPATPIDP